VRWRHCLSNASGALSLRRCSEIGHIQMRRQGGNDHVVILSRRLARAIAAIGAPEAIAATTRFWCIVLSGSSRMAAGTSLKASSGTKRSCCRRGREGSS
jgi:hypothetical protein